MSRLGLGKFWLRLQHCRFLCWGKFEIIRAFFLRIGVGISSESFFKDTLFSPKKNLNFTKSKTKWPVFIIFTWNLEIKSVIFGQVKIFGQIFVRLTKLFLSPTAMLSSLYAIRFINNLKLSIKACSRLRSKAIDYIKQITPSLA